MPAPSSKNDLLIYEANYRVLICRPCKYAIQKSALGSHLLRHKIYRGERQRLLTSLSQLDLWEPDDVQLPPPRSPPIEGLPIISGYRCTAAECDCLLASSKRMRRHWSENHGISDPPTSCARPVNLQTFFRGTKIRYFEVATPGSTTASPPITEDDQLQLQPGHPAALASLPQMPEDSASPSPHYIPDLDTLRYFHHFTTVTAHTLPTGPHDPVGYWQTDVVAHALRVRWLMCGLLAISTSHLITISANETDLTPHQDRLVYWTQKFFTGWEEASTSTGTGAKDAEATKIGGRMTCIQRCFHWTHKSQGLHRGILPELPPFQFDSFTAAVQGCVDSKSPHSESRNWEVPKQTAPRVHETTVVGSTDESRSENFLSGLIERIRALPFRLTEFLGKPDHAMGVLTILAAINILVECCSESCASQGDAATWVGMETWLRRLPDNFYQMVSQQEAAALVVSAHWLCLVAQAEQRFWFLKGSAIMMLRQIVDQLSPNDPIQSLIENLGI
ncbi:hypothetical protein GQ53DRAFT_265954 [Thozetella sp. PMI_491]|nr:hypothetical protein GQ53DRAFT_265954 [Thozetella sp. PMI_491]